jgi:hypothetical protein
MILGLKFVARFLPVLTMMNRRMGRVPGLGVLTLAAVLVCALPGVARAVTIEDVVALSKAGVADAVLVAVIDADRTVFTLTPQQVIDLRNSGVSDAVLVKMLGSAREFAPEPQPQPPTVGPQPEPTYGGVAPSPDDASLPPLALTYDAAYVPGTIVVPYYVPVPVRAHRPRPGRQAAPSTITGTSGFGRFINDGWNNQFGTGGFINNGWITATPQPQPRTTPPPLRTTPPARVTPPPIR